LFVSAPSGTVRTASYTLTNSGLLPLNISGITFSGPGAGFCSVVSAPTSIGAGVTLTDALVIRYTAIGAGIYTATVNIISNALASPYTFRLQGSSTSTGCN
jgi:hypothetical protein